MKDFTTTLNGYLTGVLQWEQWDALCTGLCASSDPWYVYAIGHGVPQAPLAGADLITMVREIDALLRRDHDERYLGIVYADDLQQPTLLKIYDPNNLGASCGSSGRAVPPGWILSRQPPVPIASDVPLPNNRKRWWQGLLARLTASANTGVERESGQQG